MNRWWMGVALGAAWLGLGGAARAQPQPCLPNSLGAARAPAEPIPLGPAPRPGPGPGPGGPNLTQGPISPQAAPPGPPDALSLPADHTSAFQCEDFAPESACYVFFGAMALQRQKLGSGATAVLDPNPNNIDTGLPPPPGSGTLQRYKSITPNMAWGLRGTVGYLFGNQAVELTSWYIFQNSNTIQTQGPGRIDGFWYNPPLGFEGDNGLWLQSDVMRTTLTTSLLNNELNYRFWNSGITGMEFIAGVRSVIETESLSTFTNDDAFTFTQNNGQPDPTRQATYKVRTRNYFIAPQLGVEYNTPIIKFLSVGFNAKGAWGANFINNEVSLVRGDGLVAFDTHNNRTSFAQLYETGIFLDFNILQKLRVRGGYMALWLVGVATAQDQVDFNLQNTHGAGNKDGSIFYHGPMVEMQLLF